VRYSILCSSTFDIEQKMEKSEFRVLIKHCFLMKKNTVETKEWLDKHYPDSAERNLSPMMKWSLKRRPILTRKRNRILEVV